MDTWIHCTLYLDIGSDKAPVSSRKVRLRLVLKNLFDTRTITRCNLKLFFPSYKVHTVHLYMDWNTSRFLQLFPLQPTVVSVQQDTHFPSPPPPQILLLHREDSTPMESGHSVLRKTASSTMNFFIVKVIVLFTCGKFFTTKLYLNYYVLLLELIAAYAPLRELVQY